MNLVGRKALVVGLGRSGLAAARLLVRQGARVTVTDRRDDPSIRASATALGPSVRMELGGHEAATFRDADVVVLSPGVPAIPELGGARGEVLGEFEFGCRFLCCSIVAVTGTNGKSTTTSLLASMLERLGRPLFVGGNLGTPVCEAVGGAADCPEGIVVVEVSSFQLETVSRYHAKVAVLLNITEDHLDRYPDFDAYAAAKTRVFANQTSADFAVVRGDLRQRAKDATPAQLLTFLVDGPADARLEREHVVLGRDRVPLSELALVGRHNAENVMAALLAARCLGVPPPAGMDVARSFAPLPHRMERVAEVAGVVYFDDSKATNVGAVARSLEGFPRPVVLIAGGRDKGGSYGPLVDVVQRTARAVVLIGEARGRIAEALGSVVPVDVATDMGDAVRRAAARAHAGDAVVLSPACSSFDMFDNFEARGRAFRTAVEALS